MNKIKTAWLTTNRTCNNTCEWCYAQTKIDNSSMDFEQAKKAIDLLRENEIKKIVLIGGEPTIYKDFIRIIKYIKSKDMIVAVATNGRKFKDMAFAKEVVNSGVDSINVSLKGISEKMYKKNTGKYGLHDTLEGYKNLEKLNFKPTLSYVIINANEAEFKDLIKLLEDNKIMNVFLQFVKPTVDFNTEDNSIQLIRLGNFVTCIYRLLENSYINYNLEISFPLCLIENNILTELINKNRIKTGCHIQNGTGIVFDTDFKVLPCNHFAKFPFSEKPLDISNKNSINELWESKEVENFRKTTQSYPANKCIKCELWNRCGGGCFTRWLFTNLEDVLKMKKQLLRKDG